MSEAPINEDRNSYADAWHKWLMLTVPSTLVAYAASTWFGFGRAMPVLIGLLIIALSYQRIVNRRSWRSILFGVHAVENRD